MPQVEIQSFNTYADLNPIPQYTLGNPLAFNEDCIRNSIITILYTRRGTRVFRRDFGSNLLDLVFLPLDDLSVVTIRDELKRAVTRWEPRALNTVYIVRPDYANEQYYIQIDFQTAGLKGTVHNVNFNLSKPI